MLVSAKLLSDCYIGEYYMCRTDCNTLTLSKLENMNTYNSSADDDAPADKKKLPTNVRFQKDLSWNKRIKVQIWQGEPRIDIRWYENYFQVPLKKGISLTLPYFKMLEFNKELLTEALEICVKRELGTGVYASVTPQWTYVDIRQYFLPEDASESGGDKLPTKKGLMLNSYEWKKLWNWRTLLCVWKMSPIRISLLLCHARNVTHSRGIMDLIIKNYKNFCNSPFLSFSC